MQERSWVQEAVGDLAKGGKFLLDAIATKTSNNTPSRRATTCNPGARGANESSILKHEAVQARAPVAADMGLSYNARKGVVSEADLSRPLEGEDCTWETDPNGGWLGSFQ